MRTFDSLHLFSRLALFFIALHLHQPHLDLRLAYLDLFLRIALATMSASTGFGVKCSTFDESDRQPRPHQVSI